MINSSQFDMEKIALSSFSFQKHRKRKCNQLRKTEMEKRGKNTNWIEQRLWHSEQRGPKSGD